jgi:tryptophan halogenase
MWQQNVVAVGNAAGFVEPLEASSLQVIIIQCRSLADSLIDSECEPSPSVQALYNTVITSSWDDVRDFLAVHYKFNTRLDTPFWRACRDDISLAGAQAVCEFYSENGPSSLANNYVLSSQNPTGWKATLPCSWDSACLTVAWVVFPRKTAPPGALTPGFCQHRTMWL